MDYRILPIKKLDYESWILHKHYAHRMPPVSYAFGLYSNKLEGVCTFGMPPNYTEMEAWRPYDLLELNRLITNEGLPKNTLSYFVSHCIKLLTKPVVLISYSDLEQGHHGYIYQATNWLYTGLGGEGSNIYIKGNGKELHQRTVDIGDGGKYKRELYEKGIIISERKAIGKARYYYFNGNKIDKIKMKKMLRFSILPYPKGDNKEYDTSYKPKTQELLF